jgi:hypothetical protein
VLISTTYSLYAATALQTGSKPLAAVLLTSLSQLQLICMLLLIYGAGDVVRAN